MGDKWLAQDLRLGPYLGCIRVCCHGRSVFAFILKSLSLDMIEVARDRGIVHMIVTRARMSLDRT